MAENFERQEAGAPEKGLIQRPELLDQVEMHKRLDGAKSEKAEKAEQERVQEMRDQLADPNRTFGKDHDKIADKASKSAAKSADSDKE